MCPLPLTACRKPRRHVPDPFSALAVQRAQPHTTASPQAASVGVCEISFFSQILVGQRAAATPGEGGTRQGVDQLVAHPVAIASTSGSVIESSRIGGAPSGMELPDSLSKNNLGGGYNVGDSIRELGVKTNHPLGTSSPGSESS